MCYGRGSIGYMVCKVSNLLMWPITHKCTSSRKPTLGSHVDETQISLSWGLGKFWEKIKKKFHAVFPFFTFFLGFFSFLLASFFLLILMFFFFLFFLLCSDKFVEQLSTLYSFFFWFVLQWSSLVCSWCLGGAMKPLLPLFYHCKLFSKLEWLSM